MMVYLKHSELPKPSHIQTKKENVFDSLEEFLTRFKSSATRFTIADDGVNGFVCAFGENQPKILGGVMVFTDKECIRHYLEQSQFQCHANQEGSVIHCYKTVSSKL